MIPTEAVGLARYIRAHFPQQPIDEYTADALGELLAPYSFADCRAAVLAIAERGEHWCSPTDVKAQVKRIRAKRIDEHPPIVPPQGLSDAEELAWLGNARRHIADGGTVDPDGGRELKPRDVRALGLIGRGIDDEPGDAA